LPVSLNYLKLIASKLASMASILLSLSTLLICTESQSQENNLTIGIADLVVNKVYGNSLTSRIKNGQKIRANQRIRTGRNSATSISLKDNSIIKIGEIADVYMDNIIFDRTGSSLNGSMEMVTGLLRFTSGKIHKINIFDGYWKSSLYLENQIDFMKKSLSKNSEILKYINNF